MATKKKRAGAGEPKMESPLSLEKLYFGKDDAESDFARGGLLKQGFMRTRAYDEALAGGKNLIIGRKGSGKSAICLMMRDSLSPEKRCTLITPDEISADEIRRFNLPGIPPEQSKQLIWRYVFAVQVAKYILACGKAASEKNSNLSECISAIRKFLLDNGEIEDLSFTDRFWKVIERLKGAISVEAFSVKLAFDPAVQPPSAGARAHSQLDLVETQLNRAAELIGTISAERPFHLLVDQIEKVWSNDRESDSMVVGLLLAAKEIKKRFEFVLCTVFLRTDIYEQLQFQDRDKFRGDEFHIDWDEERLVELIFARAEASLGQEISADDLWEKLFPITVDSQPSKRYLVNRTLLRPRDIIQLCNACRDTARNNRHLSIEESDLRKAIALYSTWKLNDLQNEWLVNYPFLADVFVLLANGSYLFTRTEFTSSLDLVKNDLAARYPNLRHVFSPDTLLSVLYSIGLLGAVRQGKTCYSYAQGTERQIRQNDNEFVLHPSFRNALQSTSAMKLSLFESEFESGNRSLVTRFQREFRHGAGFESLRAPRFSRGLKYLDERVQSLAITIEKSNLPEEVRVEVGSNLTAMRNELRQAQEYSDPIVVQNVLSKLYRHLSRLVQRLLESNWLAQDKDAHYSLLETAEEFERVLYRGELREFRL
jgi:hypothetical protein